MAALVTTLSSRLRVVIPVATADLPVMMLSFLCRADICLCFQKLTGVEAGPFVQLCDERGGAV